jgi:hypothetical protein
VVRFHPQPPIFMSKWKILTVPDVAEDYEGHFRAVRLNSLGSLYWFAKHVLGKARLTTFHKYLCASLESDDLRLVLEVPMGMFKTTISTALSIWWALNWTPDDEHEMSKLGFGKRWMQYMRSVHNPNTRTLVAHEIDKRAVDIGKEVDFAYHDNDLFRQVFAGILPDRNCEWNDHAKYQKRNRDLMIDPTNPTYAYCGVGHALQGVRADNTIEDDLFGRKAQKSMLTGDGSIVQDTIRWHRQLTTRMDTASGKATRQLVVGNRWGHADLNSWIRKNQPQFEFQTHDAQGGCCKLHSEPGVPIFPEEFSWEVLEQKKIDNPPYDYAHFYRNLSMLPEECIFNKAWLRNFRFKEADPRFGKDDLRNALMIEHAVYEGTAVKDIMAGVLEITIIVDPMHARKVKREKHVIWSIGFDPESSRIYLLGLWQKDCTYSTLVEEMYKQYGNWTMRNGLKQVRTPTVYMGQTAKELLAFYLTERDKREKISLDPIEFEDDDSLAAMKNRIESLEPTFKAGQIWCNPEQGQQKEFVEDYENYPAGKLDALDVLGHYSKIVEIGDNKQAREFLREQMAAFASRQSGIAGY